MSAFSGTADYYRQYRPGIPSEVVAMLNHAAPTGSPRRLLDIGTGPGLVPEALLERFDDIIALDSDRDMISAAEAALRPRLPCGSRLQLVYGRAEEFAPPLGWRPHLVTCCRAFHWLDQQALLCRLDEYVAPGGVLAVFSDRSLWTADNDWQRAVRSVVQDFLGEQRRAGTGAFGPIGPPYRQVLRNSAFSDVTETVIPVRRTWNAEEVVGYLYSTSFAAPHLFMERRDGFESAVKAVLAESATGGVLTEDNAFTMLTARRPSSREGR
ncbi:methyltransferase domain-containing protein [Streptomyces lunaelactis]|uniref:class I SAM-dependent methyltransferase n=1 Tax=Streptomyces lunaelactis TaxID=1535768 RepID=UPI0015857DA4|nr:methyltransferase [Streptomyces lunaelactis]NUK32228.1 methyltransferase domain-containing protein [Streptomyces lunaelactis]NUK41282.1 methyltransferase domain-containing protein [Streptomyces lunaelactis]